MSFMQHGADYFDHLDREVVENWDGEEYSVIWGDSVAVLITAEVNEARGVSGYSTPTDSDAGDTITDGTARDDDEDTVGGESSGAAFRFDIDEDYDSDATDDNSYAEELQAYYSISTTFNIATFMATYEIDNFEVENLLNDEDIFPPCEPMYMQPRVRQERPTEAIRGWVHEFQDEQQYRINSFLFAPMSELMTEYVLDSMKVDVEVRTDTEDDNDDDSDSERRARKRRLAARRSRRLARRVRRRASF